MAKKTKNETTDITPKYYEALTLYRPEDKVWFKLSDDLMWYFNSDVLKNYYKPFRLFFRQYIIDERLQSGAPADKPYFQVAVTSNLAAKQDVATAFAFILAEPRNLKLYFDSLPPHIQGLYKMLMKNPYVSVHTLNTLYPYHCWATSKYSWSNELSPTEGSIFTGFTNISSYKFGWNFEIKEEKLNFYFLHRQPSTWLAPVICPDVLPTPRGMEELPSGLNLKTFTSEQQLASSFSIIKSLASQKDLAIDSSTLKLKVGIYRNIVKLCNLTSFHPLIDGKECIGNCLSLAMPLLANAYNSRSINESTDYHKVMRSIVSNFKNWFTNHRLLAFFLPHITGFQKNKLEYNSSVQFLSRFLVLAEDTKGRWTSIDDAMDSMNCHRENKDYSMALISKSEFDSMNIVNKTTEDFVMPDHFIDELSKPLIKSICCAFAGLGIMEVAYRPYNEKKDVTPFDFIQYFRLTPLGLYAFGLSKTYELPQLEHLDYFSIDDKHLIVRSLVSPNPFETVLSTMSQSIGSGRYKLTYESFLSGCATPADVEKYTEQFKQFVCDDLPPLWKDFFAEVKNRVNPLTEENVGGYKMFTLSSTNKQLIDILTSDPELRKLIIRAEGFRILVKYADLRKFSNKLKTYGYLL